LIGIGRPLHGRLRLFVPKILWSFLIFPRLVESLSASIAVSLRATRIASRPPLRLAETTGVL
jgi:hypothetical protein